MTIKGKCKILRIFVDEDKKFEGKLVYKAIMDKLLEMKLAGATVFKGIEGFGSALHMHTSRIIEVTENLPMIIEVVDKPKEIHRALNAIEPLLPKHCLVTVQDIQVLHYHHAEGKHTQTASLD
jgi:PII-like signaling protein